MSFLATLKKETTDCHQSLEESLDILRRVKTREDYRELLTRFFTLYEPLEDRLARRADWEAEGWDFSRRRKSPWLRQDLQALGARDTGLTARTRCDVQGIADTRAAAVGSLYVLEGSTLGGQMLVRQFHDTLGVTPETGGRFFHGYGAATMPQWRAFGTWGEAQAAAETADPGWENSAVRGARDTFDLFSRWLMA